MCLKCTCSVLKMQYVILTALQSKFKIFKLLYRLNAYMGCQIESTSLTLLVDMSQFVVILDRC